MTLYHFLLVVVSLSCGSLPPGEADFSRALVASIGMVIGWGLLCHVATRLISQHVLRGQIDAIVATRWLETQLSLFRWIGLGVVLLCLGGFGLAQSLDTVPGFADSMFLQACVLLMPGLLVSVATWSAEHYYGVSLGYTNKGTGNYLRSLVMAFRTSVAWLVIPVLLLLGVNDLLGRLPIDDRYIGYVTAAVIVTFVAVALPWLLRRLFKTRSLVKDYQQWVLSLLAASGVRGTKALRWETGGKTFNAMVAGFFPGVRTLLLSDRLLDELPREQVAMVVLHEAAHLRRRHVPIRMLSILPAWGVGAVLTKLAGDSQWAMILGSAAAILLTLLILRIIAYRTEFDADVEACKMAAMIAGKINGVPCTFADAADSLSLALMRVTFDQPESRKATWLHPGVADRVDFMRRVCETPQTSSTAAGTMAKPA